MNELTSLKDPLQTCAFCPKLCRFACPIAEAEARESVTPWGLLTLADDIRRSDGRVSASVAELWTHCTGCGACVVQCRHDNPVPEVISALRDIAARQQALPDALFEWASAPVSATLPDDTAPENAPCLLLPGYVTTSQIQAGLIILRAAGVGPVRWGTAPFFTAGGRLVQAGLGAEFRDFTTTVAPQLMGASRIVCFDPDDYRTLVRDWDWDPSCRPEILHLVHVAEGLFDTLRPVYQGDVVMLDSCRLARSPELPALARSALARVISGRIIETLMHGVEAGCCGGGAGYAALHPAQAAEVACEAVDGTGDVPVVAFGGCVDHLRRSVAPRRVMSWTELVAQGLSEEAVNEA